MDPDKKTFVVFVFTLDLSLKISIFLAWKAQVASLFAKKVIISAKYFNFADVISKKTSVKLLEHSVINKYLINLEPNKQPPYIPIYSLGLIELETLKTYIKTNLANNFIRLSKSLAKAHILFV